ncbi:helix-turn-helix transcriptional regulator [Limosilactobacillus reuteri]|uniref:helix-turn-helix transcriptional regulator n=1 Tax=Limosilactobacillus reuteri TaxID=1598 RepID=UPI001E2C735A|nr:helix-turn-helix transcriptional regulator [Limosilactobacillus reuteri]MCC4417524.1 helix-turn-helix transcriptional regulator [Limosilactobacillus reuteri]
MKNRIEECRRKEAGMTQEELGKVVGVSGNTISRYETSIREPSIAMWEKLASVLNVTPEYLVGWSNIPQTLKQMMKPDKDKTHDS